MLNNTMIPSVQVGAGIPLQSTQMSMAQSALPQQSVAQSAVQQNMAPVQAGSILQLPPGSMVPVQAGNSIVYVPTQPIATQQVSVQPQVQYQTQTYQAPVETQVQSQFDPSTANLQEAPQYGNTTTPQLKTLQPRIVRNELPPQYKRVVLPAKVITTRLPPIGPPPTPELNFQLPPLLKLINPSLYHNLLKHKFNLSWFHNQFKLFNLSWFHNPFKQFNPL